MTISEIQDYVPQRTLWGEPETIKVLGLDGGNRFVKWLDEENEIHCIPSWVKSLSDWEDEPEPSADSTVIVIDNLNGSPVEKYVIGKAAQELGGKPAFENNKCEMARLFVLAAVAPSDSSTLAIEKVRLALPDSRNKKNVEMLNSVTGTHSLIRNGKPFTVSIREIEPIDETRDAYRYARQNGLLLNLKVPNAVMDLGGGTGIIRLYTPSGTLDRSADIILPGTVELAKKIAAQLLPRLNESPDLALIMDAIADGSFQYGNEEEGNFKSIFPECQLEWLNEIRGKIRSTWGAKILSQIGEVLIIGGSARLAVAMEEKSKGRFKIAKHKDIKNFAQFISLFGMKA